MIKKTIYTALILFILYSVFLIFFAPKWWHGSQHQWQENVIKAQKILYDDTDAFKSVIIGSSLSTKLVTDSLPGTYNLAMAGQGIFDGFKVLTRKSKLPEHVFVEMNYAFREESEDFSSSLYSPVLYYPRKILPSLRADKQPVAVIGTATLKALGKLKSVLHKEEELEAEAVKESNRPISNDLFNQALQIQIEEYSKQPGKDTISAFFNRIKEYVNELEDKGVQVIFYEMPVDIHLEDLPFAKTSRETFYNYFPASGYNYISLPDSVEFQTTDGLHLTANEAMKYTLYLKSKTCDFIR